MTLDLFKIENNLELTKGVVLISEPLADDDYFGRSVILLVEYGEKGSVGFILNKSSDYILSDLILDLDSKFKVFKGGPVQPNTLHYIHSVRHINNSLMIEDGLFWGGDFEQIKEEIIDGLINESQIQFFLGYSGWEKDQLEEEIKRNYWIITKVKKEELFSNQSDNFWKDNIKKLGSKYKTWLNVPKDPSLN